MKLSEYLKSNFLYFAIYFISLILIIILLFLFKIYPVVRLFIIVFITIPYIFIIMHDYQKKKKFYNNIKKTLNNLDQEYLITEIIKSPSFIEGELLCNYLYSIDKSMIENINNYKLISEEFIEYLELWCHEIKTPLATSKLIIENNQNKITKSINEELEKIENYIEQVLYYSRSNSVEKDYLIKETSLREIVNKVIKRNKKDLLTKKIKLEIDVDYNVYSDSKWLEFILNQILTNSIKYQSKKPKIEIKTIKNKDNVILTIKDNGIGIAKDELSKVFDKGFTGTNGRKKYNSTGIGLYLVKKLCQKLRHSISIESILNQETTVTIIFPIGSMTNNLTNM